MNSSHADDLATARVCFERGDLVAATTHGRRVLAASPDHPDAHFLLGRIARRGGDLRAALAHFQAARTAAPDRADIALALGIALLAAGDYAAAAEAFTATARLDPASVAAWTNLGSALSRSGRRAEAEAALRQAIAVDPDCEPALANLAGLLSSTGRRAEALPFARRATTADPRSADAWTVLGESLHGSGEPGEARAAYDRALALRPDHALAAYNRAHLALDGWDLAGALAGFRDSVRLDPGYAPAWHSLLMASLYDPAATAGELADLHAAWSAQLTRPPAPLACRSADRPSAADRPLRVGYLSPDFRQHSCAYFLQPLLTAHDPQRIAVYAYSAVARPGRVTAWFEAHVPHWRVVTGLGPAAVARRIAADDLDVLVDLGGHTAGQPLAALAFRPAPVQVAWLGYPAPNGLPEMDARITDSIADPPDATKALTADRPLRIEPCFLCYAPPAEAPAPQVPATGGPVVFGSFNHLAKLNAAVVAAWSTVLRAVPGSRLLLKARQLALAETRDAVLRAFADHGIAAGRIALRPWSRTVAESLAAYGEVDVALDPFPYNGTTTTLEALWMGVPVVTLRGQRHSGRVGASLLTALGRTEWIAADTDAYVATALALAADVAGRHALRARLRDELRRSPLCDAQSFARRFEAALLALVTRPASAP